MHLAAHQAQPQYHNISSSAFLLAMLAMPSAAAAPAARFTPNVNPQPSHSASLMVAQLCEIPCCYHVPGEILGTYPSFLIFYLVDSFFSSLAEPVYFLLLDFW
jgi:hypothetical protein